MRKFLGELKIAKGFDDAEKILVTLQNNGYIITRSEVTEDFIFLNIMDNEEINPEYVSLNDVKEIK